MRTPSKAERYRKLAMRETNKSLIGLFYRLADEAERRERAAANVSTVGPATIVSMEAWLARRRPSFFIARRFLENGTF